MLMKLTPVLTCLVCGVPEHLQLPEPLRLCGLSCSFRCSMCMVWEA